MHTKLSGGNFEKMDIWNMKRWDNNINMVVRKLGFEDWRLMVLYLGGWFGSA